MTSSLSNKVYVYEKEWLFDNYYTSMKWNLQLNKYIQKTIQV